ncbi:MAG: T9SS type A sorting domain-containing protein, partial [Owenweeksia sp.]
MKKTWMTSGQLIEDFITAASGKSYILLRSENSNIIINDTTLTVQDHGVGLIEFDDSLRFSHGRVLLDTISVYAQGWRLQSMVIHADGHIYIGGESRFSYNFPPFTIGNRFFILNYDSSMNLEWGKNFPLGATKGTSFTGINSLTSNDTSLFFISNIISSNSLNFDPGISFGNLNGWDDVYYGSLDIRPCHTLDTSYITSCEPYLSPGTNRLWSQSGVYQDTSLSLQGCLALNTVYLTIDSLDMTVTNSDPLLSVSYDSSATYQWLDCDAGYTTIPGAVDSGFIPTVNGNYAVAIRKNGCTDTSACETVQTVNLPEHHSSLISGHPNPTRGIFNLHLPSACEQALVEVIDSQGKLVSRKNYKKQDKIVLKLEGETGLYMIRVSGNCGQSV